MVQYLHVEASREGRVLQAWPNFPDYVYPAHNERRSRRFAH